MSLGVDGMDGENLFSGSWYEYVHHKVRSTYLSVLGILSEKRVSSILVGSASLLAHGYYKKEYWWDIDILFPDVETLEEFRRDAAAKQQFAIEDVDDEVQTTPELYSFHTLWSHKGRSHRNAGNPLLREDSEHRKIGGPDFMMDIFVP